jgi:hypothetical protein
MEKSQIISLNSKSPRFGVRIKGVGGGNPEARPILQRVHKEGFIEQSPMLSSNSKSPKFGGFRGRKPWSGASRELEGIR